MCTRSFEDDLTVNYTNITYFDLVGPDKEMAPYHDNEGDKRRHISHKQLLDA